MLDSQIKVFQNPGSASRAYLQLAQTYGRQSILAILKRQSHAVCNSILLFHLSPKVVITFVNFDVLPQTAYLSMHHRRPLQHLECFAQFIFSGHFQKQAVITSLGRQCGPKLGVQSAVNGFLESVVNFTTWYVFGSASISEDTSEGRYWSIVKNIEPGTCASVFVCRESAQYFGDTEFYFRDGLYAASIFTGIPIFDFVIVEPTALKPYTSIDIIKLDPPKSHAAPHDPDFNALKYKSWRQQNARLIDDFTEVAERVHKDRILQIESIAASCYSDDQNGFSEANAVIERDIKRNRSFLPWRQNELKKALNQ